ncbi:MAG: sialidase family protein [Saprospiraceae bacterium]
MYSMLRHACCLLLILLFTRPVRAQEPAFQNLFGRADGIACYRIPALATAPNGDLLAAIDQRVPSCGDLNQNPDINIALRTSRDGGVTWSDLRVIADFPSGQSASDPSFIVDQTTGEIFLFYNYMDHVRYPGVYFFYVIKSTDNGRTWSAPVDITWQISRPEWSREFQFITSGGGIQTRGGDLLHCLVNLQRGVFIFGSVDHGKSWFLLDNPLQPADESKIVELPDGAWMVNARVNKAGCRYVHTSHDRGQTWTIRADTALADPGCNAGFIRYAYQENGAEKNLLLFSNPNSRNDRTNLTLRISRDNGLTWTPGRTIYAGSAAYSALAILKNGAVGVLFEKDNYAENGFVILPPAWFLDR